MPRKTGADLMEPTADGRLMDAFDVDRWLHLGSAWTVAVTIVLYTLVPHLVPESQWEYCDEVEQQGSALVSTVMLVSTVLYLMPWVSRRKLEKISGVIMSALVINGIAFLVNLHFATQKTPIVEDPILGTRVFLMRWVEWIPLAAFMTFLSEAVDLPVDRRQRRAPLINSLLQGVACVCGSLFAFAPNLLVWFSLMLITLPTQLVMFMRVFEKWNKKKRTYEGASFTQKETYSRRKFAYELLCACTMCWGGLVFLFFLNAARTNMFPNDHFLGSSVGSILFEGFFDVVAKAFYTKLIVDVHFDVFDSENRTQRQLAELRRLMAVLWNSSEDVILISVRNSSKTTAMLSPSFGHFIGASEYLKMPKRERSMTSILLECEHPTLDQMTARFVASDEVAGGEENLSGIKYAPVDPSSFIVRVASTLLEMSWGAQRRTGTIGHTFTKPNGDDCKWEVQVNHHSGNAMVAVVRDVTERMKRYEAEQIAHREALARQRDVQAVNRFTRHEVKNGLLAGIELCDSLRSAILELGNHFGGDLGSEAFNSEETQSTSATNQRLSISGETEADSGPSETKVANKAVVELYTTLHEILETVLAEAMARDVIHEIYRPRLERLDLKSVLAISGVGKMERFPLTIEGGTMPYISSDPQLLKYIVRNAVSNACKYGKDSGIVETRIRYHFGTSTLHMDIINEPGVGHNMLLAMGEDARQAVFEQGARLHSTIEDSEQRISSGDGAWIMKKCATVMDGSCEITFERTRTVFSFSCPAAAVAVGRNICSEQFKVPPDTWGMGIDDSKIQRKLLKQILMHVGVEEKRRLITGGSPEEVHAVHDLILKTLSENPSSKLVVLVDENLDFSSSKKMKAVISGSRLMEDILRKLPASMLARTLVLVRSANDSAEDVADYCARTHGFFPKAPLQPGRVCELVAPLWAGRFREENASLPPDERGNDCDEDSTATDLQQSLATVDEAVYGLAEGRYSWPQVWSALHSLKGDLMVMGHHSQFRDAVKSIAQMRGPILPVDFSKSWPRIRESVRSAIDDIEET